MIELKEKACKGTGQAKGYGCGKSTKHRIYGLGKMCCYGDWLFNSEAGRVKLNKAISKAQKPRKELEKAKTDKKARTSLGALKEQTQRLFNKYIRLRDEGLNCISSNIPYKPDFDAGHCFSVGNYEGLRFDYDNVHGQSIGDNRFKEGNHADYLINLPSRIGKKRTQELIKRAKEYKKNGYKFSRPELLEIQVEVKLKIKNLKVKINEI